MNNPKVIGGVADCIFSIDVEDWFHLLFLPKPLPVEKWDSFPSRLDRNFKSLLDLLDAHNAKSTCFFLGWVGKKFPHLVREADRRGHEVASHGYAHRLVFEMSPGEFYEDAVASKKILEDAAGIPVQGYRASAFSVTEKTPWFFDRLIEAGYRYDASVFPTPREGGGLIAGPLAPHAIQRNGKAIFEIPMSVAQIWGRRLCFFGGGYLRFYPYFLIDRMSKKVLAEGRPVVFYLHPREIDPAHPRLPMSLRRRFKSYVNLKTVPYKLGRILTGYKVTTFERFLAENPIPAQSDVL